MNSQESGQAWLTEVLAQTKDSNDKKTLLNKRKAEVFMKIELLTKLRHQLKTNLLDLYKQELEQIQAEIKSLDDLRHDLSLIESNLKEQYHLAG